MLNLFMILLVPMSLQAPATPGQAAGSAAIEGRIVKAGTSDPVSRATVDLETSEGDRVRYSLITRDDGRFLFPAVAPGSYRIAVTRPGFVSAEYGRRKASGRGEILEVAAGQDRHQLEIDLTPTGAISGRVIDKTGRPVVNAEVQALKPSYLDGVRVLKPVQSTTTDDLGEYRLFWLTPGSYFVGAIGPAGGAAGTTQIIIGPGESSPGLAGIGGGTGGFNPLMPVRLTADSSGPPPRLQPVYYPNTADDQAAQTVDVDAAGEASVDILMASTIQTRHVHVVATDETNGPPSPQVRITGWPAIGGANVFRPYSAAGDYQTDISTAATILTVNIPAVPPLPRDAPVPLRIGRIAIPAGESDLDGVQVVLKPGTTVPGKVTLESAEGSNPPRLTSFQVALTAEPKGLLLPFLNPRSGEGAVSDNGMFTLPNVFQGDYHVVIKPLLDPDPKAPPIPAALQHAYVKSIRLGDNDVLNGMMQSAVPPDSVLTIVIANDAVSVAGLATTDKQDPDADSTVVLVPANRSRSDLFRSAKTDLSGKFKLDRVPPGDYTLFAWDEVEPGAWQDPQFMKRYEDRGIPIHVDEKGTAGLRVIVQ